MPGTADFASLSSLGGRDKSACRIHRPHAHRNALRRIRIIKLPRSRRFRLLTRAATSVRPSLSAWCPFAPSELLRRFCRATRNCTCSGCNFIEPSTGKVRRVLLSTTRFPGAAAAKRRHCDQRGAIIRLCTPNTHRCSITARTRLYPREGVSGDASLGRERATCAVGVCAGSWRAALSAPPVERRSISSLSRWASRKSVRAAAAIISCRSSSTVGSTGVGSVLISTAVSETASPTFSATGPAAGSAWTWASKADSNPL